MSILSKVVGLVLPRGGESGGSASRFVVMSPLNERADEKKTLLRLFDAGLALYHLRRPHWSLDRCRAWLGALPESARSRIVVHQFPQLVRRFGLAGTHFSARGGNVPAGTAAAGELSAQCESYQEMLKVGKKCRRIMLGPVFPPKKYDVTVPRRTLSEHAAAAAYWRAHGGGNGARILAFGGIDASNVRRCREAGFDGAVVVSAVWDADDPARAFTELVRRW